MKKLLLSSLAGLILTTGSALAADLGMPVKAPYAPPPPAANWTGCYVNGGVGYGLFNQENYSVVGAPAAAFTTTSNGAGEGWLGRVGAGCDYQTPLFGNRLVIGAFGDFDFMDLKGNVSGLEIFGTTTQKERDAWAVGGRVGYLVTPALLSYVNGGYTEARFDGSEVFTNTVPAIDTGVALAAQTYNGWFVGGGVEYALNSILPISGLFWRTEYRYAQYQGEFVPVTGVAVAPGAAEHIRPDVQTITSGLVWRFNFGGPVATRY